MAREREEQERADATLRDAEKRLQILRGLREPSPSPAEQERQQNRRGVEDDFRGRERRDHKERQRKRRRLAGENDTDRDIRLAREDVEGSRSRRGVDGDDVLLRRPTSDAPLVDEAGRINLFPVEEEKRDQKNPEAEAEAARRNREFEDQYTMRFSNAAGYKRGMMEKPWYSSSGLDLAQENGAMPSRDVWGNEDPRRREREKARTDANDPLAAMRKGVRQLRAVELERKKWEDERRRESDALKEEQREERRRRRRRRSRSRSPARSIDSLEDFRLDDCAEDKERRRKQRSRREREDREYRSDRSRHRSKHRSRRSDG